MTAPLKPPNYAQAFDLDQPEWVWNVTGQTTHLEKNLLTILAACVPAQCHIVEIGTYHGQSALALAWGASVGAKPLVYTVDGRTPYRSEHPEHNSIEDYGPQDLPPTYAAWAAAPENVSRLIHPVSLPWEYALAGFGAKSVGLLFLDGPHDETVIYHQVLAWRPCLRPGAYLVLHDWNYPEVRAGMSHAMQTSENAFYCEAYAMGIAVFRYAPDLDTSAVLPLNLETIQPLPTILPVPLD